MNKLVMLTSEEEGWYPHIPKKEKKNPLLPLSQHRGAHLGLRALESKATEHWLHLRESLAVGDVRDPAGKAQRRQRQRIEAQSLQRNPGMGRLARGSIDGSLCRWLNLGKGRL